MSKSILKIIKPRQRFISYNGAKMLEKIQKIEPDWNNWIVEVEVWAKAKKLGLF